MRIVARLHDWYRGEYVAPPPNDADSSLVFISAGYYEQPFAAKMLRVAGHFWLANWSRLIGLAIAALGVYFAARH